MNRLIERIGAFSVSMLMLAVIGGRALPASAQTLVPLHVATTPIDTGAQVYYAIDMGFFKKAGLDVDVANISAGPAIAAGVAAGTYEIAQSNVSSLAEAHERNFPFTIISAGGLWTSGALTTALVVLKNSPIQSGKDVNGKIVAVNALKNVTQVAAQAWIDKNGGDSTTVKFLELPFSQMVPALLAGRIDVGFVPEPELDNVEHGTIARILGAPYDAIAKQFLISAWFTTNAYAQAHPDVVKKFQDAMAESARWANTHPAESAQILKKYTQLEVTPTMARIKYAEKLVPGDVQPLIEAAVKYGTLKASFPAADLFAAGARR
jgi:NitT/TauT family transport system substrate-binding protein